MRARHFLALFALVAIALPTHGSDQIPAKPQDHPILLSGGDVYTVSGDVIRNGQVLFDKGKIVSVGQHVDGSSGAQVIDCTGKRVYPGLIDASTDIGLVEIDSIRATRDGAETGQVNPNVRAEVAVNPDSELIPVARTNGVLLSVTVPTGGLLSGTSALIQLDGWTWEDMTVKAPVAMHLVWPGMAPRRAWWMRETEAEQAKKREESLRQITQIFSDARAYLDATKADGPASGADSPAMRPDFDARWNAMLPLLRREIPLVVSADEVQQIQGAVAFAQKQNVRLIILGGYDAPLCADLLRKYHVPVIVDGVQRLPQRRGSAYDEPFTLPQRLRELGIPFAISGSRGASLARNLPYHAATAVAFGLPADEALRSITLYPAQILGVSERVGSIEPGKDATLIVCNGDVLETPTHVEQAFVQGRAIDLSNRQTRLWEKYREKYRRLAPQNSASR
ncbi:MAG: amidohydrolase family protein [Tepidisphaeraceae bacterium]